MKRNQEILKILKSNEYFYLNKELILKKIKKIEKSYKILKIKKERSSESVLQILLMSIMIFFFPSIFEIMLNTADIENVKNITYMEYFLKACPYIGCFMFIIYFISLPFCENGYSKEYIDDKKLNKIIKNHKEILELLSIDSLKKLNKKATEKNILKNLLVNTEYYLKEIEKEENYLFLEYIEIYKNSSNKDKIMKDLKTFISEDTNKYKKIKNGIYDKIIDLQKDIDFKTEKLNKDVFISSI